jgi:peptidoglycan/LPS O-acetylase OafA/YrhL
MPMSSTTHVQGRNFRSLEGLRGYMAWTVVLMHVMYFSGYAHRFPGFLVATLINGDGAVNVFIVVSGFVITHLLLAKEEPYKSYLLRRGFRIIPIYYLCLLLAFVLLPAQRQLHLEPWGYDHKVWENGFDVLWQNVPAYLLLHVTLLHGMVPDSALPMSSWVILGPAWSLSLEWQFYLIAPVLLRVLRIGMRSQILSVALLLGSWFAFRSGIFGVWNQPAVLPLSIHFFLLGILCRLHLAAIAASPRWLVPLLGIAAMLAFRPIKYEMLVWTVFLSAILIEIRPVTSAGLLQRRFNAGLTWVTSNRIAVLLGKSSYSTYLVHIPFLSAVVWLGAHFFGLRGQVATLVMMLAALPLLALLSLTLYRVVEAPFIRLGARYAAVEPIVPTALSSAGK